MEKITKVEKVNNCLEWTYGVPLSQIKEDIDKLEKQGITHINIEIADNYGSQYISIETEIQRLETDGEFDERVNIEKKEVENN